MIDVFKENPLDLFSYKNSFESLTGLPSFSPLEFKDCLEKYDTKESIKYRFPYFIDKNNRAFYDTIYKIKTENSHCYIDANNKIYCDTILICCVGKTFNILFELDKKNPYFGCSNNSYNESRVRDMYSDNNI